MSKRLTVLGGPNGVGKSTAFEELRRMGFVTGAFLNPDNIARELGGDSRTRDLRAGRETLRRARSWIEEGRTFTRESTLTSKEIVRRSGASPGPSTTPPGQRASPPPISSTTGNACG